MLTIEPRLRAAAKKHRGSKSVVSDLSFKLNESRKKKLAAEQEIRWCEGFLEFQSRNAVSEYSDGLFKLYEVEDGETHMVAATSADHAIQYYAVDLSGYESLEKYKMDVLDYEVAEVAGDTVVPVYDVDDTGKLIVKTAAEWADVDKPVCISSTVY